jgi:hypothetical protein
MTLPVGSLHSLIVFCAVLGYSGNEKRNEFISAFYIGYSGNEKQNEFISTFYIGYSGNEKQNDLWSAFLLWVFWQ